jgi:hypothetical protein
MRIKMAGPGSPSQGHYRLRLQLGGERDEVGKI